MYLVVSCVPGKELTYVMKADHDTFTLKPEKQLDHSTSLKILTNHKLDRETIAEYDLYIEAKDGGSPQLSSTLTVHVKVSTRSRSLQVFSCYLC
jgi:hypothetical protein